MSTNKPILYMADGSEIELPIKWKICGTCRGHGKSSAYLGAFTRGQLEEEGSEFIEDYVDGKYDRACDACGGSGKIAKADLHNMPTWQRKLWEAQQREDAETKSIERMERLMEGGWREEGWFGE
jgi:hypothetical protein